MRGEGGEVARAFTKAKATRDRIPPPQPKNQIIFPPDIAQE